MGCFIIMNLPLIGDKNVSAIQAWSNGYQASPWHAIPPAIKAGGL
jgi:hypothetical protein